MHVYLATGLEAAHPERRLQPEEDEHLRVELVPFDGAIAAVEAGEIRDAKSIVGLLWVARERAATGAMGGSRRADPGESPTVDVTWRPTMTDIILGSAAQVRRSRGAQVFSVLMLAAGMFLTVTSDLLTGLAGLVIGIGTLTGFFVAPFAWWTIGRNRARYLAPVRVMVGPAGFTYESPTIQSRTPWSAVSRIAENRAFLFVELGPQVVSIALRAFSEAELREVRRLAAAAGFGPDGRRRGTPPAQ
jgi:hypothetical protein